MRSVAALLLLASVPGAQAQQAAGDAAITFSHPAQARAIPALRRWLDREDALLRSAVESQAAADQRDAVKNGRPFLRHETDRTWKVVADTPRFLSLSLERYDFTGGAHGNTSFGTIVWDKTAARPRTPLSFFRSPQALSAAIRPAFCRKLDAERRRKRGGDGPSGFAEFDRCIDPVGQTLILGSARGGRFDRLGILVAPYEAGPYAEGSYEVTLPVTRAVLSAVQPAWRPYFAVGGASRGTP